MSNLTIDTIFLHFFSHAHRILVNSIPAIKKKTKQWTSKRWVDEWTHCFLLSHLLAAFRNQSAWRTLMDTQQSCPLPVAPMRGHAATRARSCWINHNRTHPNTSSCIFLWLLLILPLQFHYSSLLQQDIVFYYKYMFTIHGQSSSE